MVDLVFTPKKKTFGIQETILLRAGFGHLSRLVGLRVRKRCGETDRISWLSQVSGPISHVRRNPILFLSLFSVNSVFPSTAAGNGIFYGAAAASFLIGAAIVSPMNQVKDVYFRSPPPI